jgi:TetR/AcrR family transcriptional repressor of nem operon
MKKSKAETAETRRRIIDAAAQRLIATGIEGTGLNDLMAEAGLTRGGFYRHFASKDQLVAEACAAGLDSTILQARQARQAREEGRSADGFATVVNAYLSPRHRDNRAGGCPFAGLGSELARADGEVRKAASLGFDQLAGALEALLTDRSPQEARAQAAYTLSAMVGALTMARMVEDPALSDAILSEARQQLTGV